MLITTVHRRYARSLIGFSQEQDKLEEVRKDVDTILSVLDDSREFRVMLKSPVIKADKKGQIMDALFKDKVTVIMSHFIKIVIDHRREEDMEEILRSFINQYRTIKGVEEAVITTAHPLTGAQREEIGNKLAQVTGKKMQITEQVDASLIGGMKVRVGDRQYNGSIASQLNELRRNFKKNDFVAEF